jgi:hypothetical protein
MGTSSKVHPANGTDSDDQGPSKKDLRLLDRLVKLWEDHTECDLGTRHQMGKLLNERLGPPTERQPHGQRVLKMAAEKLAIAESELNRMRWFAHLFGDVAAFRQSHPENASWTTFKAELPDLKAKHLGREARKPAANSSRPATRGVARTIASLTAKLNRLDTPPVGAERAQLVAVVQELAKAATRRLKIRVEVSVGVKDSKPVATKKTNRVA